MFIDCLNVFSLDSEDGELNNGEACFIDAEGLLVSSAIRNHYKTYGTCLELDRRWVQVLLASMSTHVEEYQDRSQKLKVNGYDNSNVLQMGSGLRGAFSVSSNNDCPHLWHLQGLLLKEKPMQLVSHLLTTKCSALLNSIMQLAMLFFTMLADEAGKDLNGLIDGIWLSSHELMLLVMVLCFGAVTDTTQPGDNVELSLRTIYQCLIADERQKQHRKHLGIHGPQLETSTNPAFVAFLQMMTVHIESSRRAEVQRQQVLF
ncbi:uncharacterized protein LAESUDRAFT_718471 [Laetiporus sulphureus 93-53]|uniref:Uncharacterized protein n=1 Tax=Laetiporus sulphureus 93-53 TaxID=1314785 RepID=A0A165AXP5_9APHY|nr:uncharacterized protein LAESUDRAFT_718471 [Laetiporus sulphureus 93-53]KZS99856.1 hypothetical protein LAESUDRAFT_718471 [Laetiporus sulphureus 93-53]